MGINLNTNSISSEADSNGTRKVGLAITSLVKNVPFEYREASDTGVFKVMGAGAWCWIRPRIGDVVLGPSRGRLSIDPDLEQSFLMALGVSVTNHLADVIMKFTEKVV